jgi:hypothetical protein
MQNVNDRLVDVHERRRINEVDAWSTWRRGSGRGSMGARAIPQPQTAEASRRVARGFEALGDRRRLDGRCRADHGPPSVGRGWRPGILDCDLHVLWSAGDVRALPYVWGALGEQQTAGVLAQLGNHWLCLHDITRARGNWDHICVGPAGVFAIESKTVGGQAVVTNDSLRCGRLLYRGAEFRHAAGELKEEIGRQGIPSPYVQAVVVIWGNFPQRFHVEEQVT